MRELVLGLIAIPLLLMVSCKDETTPITGQGKLVIAPGVDTKTLDRDLTRATPTENFSTYTLILDGPTPKTILFPTDGQVSDLATGEYTVTVTSHTEIPAPAFDLQVYTGKTTVTVKPNESAPAAIVLTQANAGVYFEYDQSLADAGLELTPTVRNSAGSLVYSGSDKESWGYFAPGEVTVTVSDGQNEYPLNGELEQVLTLKAREVWKVTLTRETAPETGSLTITMTVEVRDDYTDEVSFTVGEPSPREEYIEMIGYTLANYYGSEINNNEGPSEFMLRLADGTGAGAQTIALAGFTQNAPFESFVLAPGIYNVASTGEAMTIWPGAIVGQSVSPSYGGIMNANNQLTTVYLVQGGTVTVELSGNTYTIKTDLSGTEYPSTPFENLRYQFTGMINWSNQYVPPGDLEFTDVNAGTYSATGTPDGWMDPVGPSSWTQTLARQYVNGTLPVYAITGFAGVSDQLFPIEFDSGNAFLGTTISISDNQTYRAYAEANYVDGEDLIFVSNYVVPFDKVSQTFDFTGQVNGNPIMVGLHAYSYTTGNWIGAETEQYFDMKFVHQGTRSGAAYDPSNLTTISNSYYLESPTGFYKPKANIKNIRRIDYKDYIRLEAVARMAK